MFASEAAKFPVDQAAVIAKKLVGLCLNCQRLIASAAIRADKPSFLTGTEAGFPAKWSNLEVKVGKNSDVSKLLTPVPPEGQNITRANGKNSFMTSGPIRLASKH
jgi:hypothetical protein